MTKEQEYLISLLAAYISGEKIILQPDTDFRQLFNTAKIHNLACPVFCAISGAENANEINENLFAKYQGAFLDSVYINNMQMQIFGEIKKLFCAEGIKFVPFKGAVLRELYPDPEARTMGDIDLLIEKGRQKQVKKLLCESGFECTVCGSGEWVYTKGGVIAEIHTSLINGKIGNSTADEFFENAIQKAEFNGCEGRLLPQYHFEYILAHLAHHFGNCGAGIKMVLDLAVMLNAGGIDLAAASADFEEMGLGKFSQIILAICKKWFGCGAECEYNIRQTEDFIASHGAFGNVGRNKAVVVERTKLAKGSAKGTFSAKLALLFPSYEEMCSLSYIRFLKGRRYLTPLAWAIRFFRNLFCRRSEMMKLAKEVGSSENTAAAKAELEYYREIGLL